MKDFFEILKENEIEVPEEKKQAVKQQVFENYKSVTEYENKVNKLNDELTKAKDTVTALETETEKLKTSGANVEDLQSQLDAYKKAEQDRKDAEKKAEALAGLKARFAPLKGDKSFLNEGTENWIFSEFEKAIALDENKGKGDAEIYEAITKDKNIYENPNKPFTNPKADQKGQDEKGFKTFF